MRGRVILGLALVVLLALPLVLSPYRLLLMLPFMAYGVILLGLNLLFAYAASSRSATRSSWHRRLHRGLPRRPRGIRSIEVVVLVAAILGRSWPPWWACSACAT